MNLTQLETKLTLTIFSKKKIVQFKYHIEHCIIHPLKIRALHYILLKLKTLKFARKHVLVNDIASTGIHALLHCTVNVYTDYSAMYLYIISANYYLFVVISMTIRGEF